MSEHTKKEWEIAEEIYQHWASGYECFAVDSLANYTAALKAQRDELLAAAKTAYEVLIQERDHIPMTLRLVMPNGAIKRLRAAIANAERPAGC